MSVFYNYSLWALIDELCMHTVYPCAGHSPLQGSATPFPAGTRDYVQDNSFSSVAGSAPWDRASHIQPKFEAG